MDWKHSGTLANFGTFLKGRGITKADLTKEGVSVVLYGDIYTKYNLFTKKFDRKTSFENAQKAVEVFKEDLLFTASGETKEDIGKCVVYLGKDMAFASGDVIILRQNVNNSMFLSYVFNSFYVNIQKAKLAKGEIVVHIYSSQLRNIHFALPPIEEQTQIANYLDLKTQQIDALIEKKERLIALLEEERTAIINQAVTGGLDPNAKMKDSGIDWLGEIPDNWEAKSIKYVAILKSGENITSEKMESDKKYPVYGGNGLRGYYSEYTNEGDFILIGRQGALCGNIKYISGKFWASEHAVVCYLNHDYNWIWFGKLLETMNLNQYNQSAAQPGLAVSLIKNLKIPSPPFSEQLRIIEFIDKYEKSTNSLIKKYIYETELLKEYKTALISEVVTGKIDVREKVSN